MPGATGSTGYGYTGGYTGDPDGFDDWVQGGQGSNELWDSFTPTGFPVGAAIPSGAVTPAPTVPEGSDYYSLSEFADRTAQDWLNPVATREATRWNPFQEFLGGLLDAILGLPKGTTGGASITTIYTALTGLKDKADESFRTAIGEKIANKAADALVRFEGRAELNVCLDGDFNGPNYKRFPLTDEQFSGYAIGEEAHSGVKAWKWVQYPGLACGFQMAPTTRIKHVEVFEGEEWFAEAWVFPDSGNHAAGAMQIGCTVSDTTGELDDLDVLTDIDTGFECSFPFNGPDMVKGQWNKINIRLEIPGPPVGASEGAGYDQAVFWVRSTANTTTNDTWWLDDVLLKQETTPAKAQAQANVAEVVVNLKAKAGGNLVVDPGFNTMITRYPYNDDQEYERVSVLSGGQAHTGLASWKWVQETGADCGFLFNPTGKVADYAVKEPEQYSMSAYVYSPSTNSAGGSMQIGATFSDSAGVLPDVYDYEDFPRSGISANTWVKLETVVTVPAGYTTAKFWVIANAATPAGCVFFVDDVHLLEASRPQNIIDKIHEAIVGAAPATPRKVGTVAERLQEAWSDFVDGLGGTTGSAGKLPSDVKTKAGLLKIVADDAFDNADLALGNNTATNKAIYKGFFGSSTTPSGTDTEVNTTVAAIKQKLGDWTVETITVTGTWSRPWTPGDPTAPTEMWAICVGGGSGGGRGISNISGDGSTRVGGVGGSGGRWLAKRIDPNSVTSTVSATIGGGGAGDSWSSGNASPENGSDTSFGSYCATGPGIEASVADFIGYYSCADSRPGYGGNGGGFDINAGTAGDSTPLAAGGGGGGSNSNGWGGNSASMTEATRAGGGGGGGGGYGPISTAPGVGGNGGWPGGGGGGGGASVNASSTAGGNGGSGAAGVVILLYK